MLQKSGRLQTTEVYSVATLEAGDPGIKGSMGHAPLDLSEEPLFASFMPLMA